MESPLLRIKRQRMKRRTSFIEDKERENYRKILNEFTDRSSGKKLQFHSCFQLHTYERSLIFRLHEKYKKLRNSTTSTKNNHTNLQAVVESKNNEMEFWKKKYYHSMKLFEPLHQKQVELVEILRNRERNVKNLMNSNQMKESGFMMETKQLENQINLLNIELENAQNEMRRNEKVERENKNLQKKVHQLNLKGKKVEELTLLCQTYKDLADQFETRTSRLKEEVKSLNTNIQQNEVKSKMREAQWKEEKEELETYILKTDQKEKEIKKGKKKIKKLTDELRKANADAKNFKDKMLKLQRELKAGRKKEEFVEPKKREALKYSNIHFKINHQNRVEVNKNIITMINNPSKDGIRMKNVFIQTNISGEVSTKQPTYHRRRNNHSKHKTNNQSNRHHPLQGSENVNHRQAQRTKELEHQVEELRKQLMVYQKSKAIMGGGGGAKESGLPSISPSRRGKGGYNFRAAAHAGFGSGSSSTKSPPTDHRGGNYFSFGKVGKTNYLGGNSGSNVSPMLNKAILGFGNGNGNGGGGGGGGRGKRKASSLPQKYLRNRLKDMNRKRNWN